jgi:hypothetical protein
MKKRKNVKLSLKKTKVSELNESFQEGLKGGKRILSVCSEW